MKNPWASLTAIILVGLSFPVQAASVIYEYTGQPFFPLSPNTPPIVADAFPPGLTNVSARIELTNFLPAGFHGTVNPLSVSMSDGATTITDQTPGYFSRFILTTDNFGEVIFWTARFFIQPGNDAYGQVDGIYTLAGSSGSEDAVVYCAGLSSTGSCAVMGQRFTFNAPGSWSAFAVPVPAAVWLFGSAFALLVGIRRKSL